MDRKAGNIPVVGQSFSKFMNYNDMVMTHVISLTQNPTNNSWTYTNYWPWKP